jgi:hypothetical protein
LQRRWWRPAALLVGLALGFALGPYLYWHAGVFLPLLAIAVEHLLKRQWWRGAVSALGAVGAALLSLDSLGVIYLPIYRYILSAVPVVVAFAWPFVDAVRGQQGARIDVIPLARRWWRVGVWLVGVAFIVPILLVSPDSPLGYVPAIACPGIVGTAHLIRRRWLRGGIHLFVVLAWILYYLYWVEELGEPGTQAWLVPVSGYSAVLGSLLLIIWSVVDAIRAKAA